MHYTVAGREWKRIRPLAETVLLYKGFRALGLWDEAIAHRLGLTLSGLRNALWRAKKKGLL